MWRFSSTRHDMAAYYNEIDPYAAQWLRNLIAAGHIANGDVDERSIVDVQPSDLAGYTQCHFFAGIGGWSYALRLAAWPAPRAVWTGSCPCQPLSRTGKRKGHADERHLWPAFLLSSPSVDLQSFLASRLQAQIGVNGSLEYVLTWKQQDMPAGLPICVLRARARHTIGRGYIGWPTPTARDGQRGTQAPREWGHGRSAQPSRDRSFWDDFQADEGDDGSLRRFSASAFPLAHGVPARVGRLRAYGNAI